MNSADLCDRYPDELRIVPGHWQWFGARRQLSGPVLTLQANGCNGEIRRALAEPGAGRVLVIDAGDDPGALLGDRLAALALANGWAGVLVCGNVRDRHALAALDLGIVALGTWPRRSHNRDGGTPDVSLRLGGVAVEPGDWLYADEDGVLVGPAALDEDAITRTA